MDLQYADYASFNTEPIRPEMFRSSDDGKSVEQGNMNALVASIKGGYFIWKTWKQLKKIFFENASKEQCINRYLGIFYEAKR